MRTRAYVEKLFRYDHLPDDLAGVSQQFADLADRLFEQLEENPERTVALRKLLEAKDAAVRAKVMGREKD